ncbi:MAG: lipocalin family protein [Cyclobacteriaceae bacterium]
MKKALKIFFLLFLAACSQEKIDSASPLAGNWKIESTTCDGQDQPEWSGTTFNILTISKDSLRFVMSSTPNDTVWNNSGKLKIIDQDRITRNDGVDLTYFVNVKQLQIHFFVFLKSKQVPCSPSTDPCIPLGRGSFVFTLSKD